MSSCRCLLHGCLRKERREKNGRGLSWKSTEMLCRRRLLCVRLQGSPRFFPAAVFTPFEAHCQLAEAVGIFIGYVKNHQGDTRIGSSSTRRYLSYVVKLVKLVLARSQSPARYTQRAAVAHSIFPIDSGELPPFLRTCGPILFTRVSTRARQKFRVVHRGGVMRFKPTPPSYFLKMRRPLS